MAFQAPDAIYAPAPAVPADASVSSSNLHGVFCDTADVWLSSAVNKRNRIERIIALFTLLINKHGASSLTPVDTPRKNTRDNESSKRDNRIGFTNEIDGATYYCILLLESLDNPPIASVMEKKSILD